MSDNFTFGKWFRVGVLRKINPDLMTTRPMISVSSEALNIYALEVDEAIELAAMLEEAIDTALSGGHHGQN